VAAVIAQAGRAWASLTDRDTALGAVVELAARVADCDGAGITIRDTDSGAAITAGSNQLARSADQLQALLQQGPGLDQAWPQDIVCTELAAAQRWPDWAPTAANLGLHSILTVHLYTDRHPLGALTLYSARSRVYHPEDLATAHLVGAHASAALTRLRTERHLGLAIDARNVIGQAQGILMVRHHITAAQSFTCLTRMSQTSNTKLRRIAEHIIHTGGIPPTLITPVPTGSGDPDPAADAERPAALR
jgi:GAF domain-containing protein